MAYIENQQEATFFILSEIMEDANKDSFDFSQKPVEEVKALLPKISYTVGSRFVFKGVQVNIKTEIFDLVIKSLLEKQLVVGELEKYCGAELFCESQKSAFSLGVSMCKVFPDVPASDLAVDTYFTFLIKNKEGLKSLFDQTSAVDVSEASHSVVYQISYTKDRRILINGKLLSQPNMTSQTAMAFDYIFRHPNMRITKEAVQSESKEFYRSLGAVIRDLGFEGELKRIFFPQAANTALEFCNPVSSEDLDDDLKNVDIGKLVDDFREERKNKK